MSDFFSPAWSWYVAAATVLSIVACLVLLFVVALKKTKLRTDRTTGHVWDEDLREMNNPMPMWWMGLFVITIVFSAVYLVIYPGLGSFAGRGNWTSATRHANEMRDAAAQMKAIYARFEPLSMQELAQNPEAMGIAQRLFLNNCAQCHGSDARGFKGFPNLADTDWLWGGSPEQITQTIQEGRTGVMPPLAAAIGSSDDVRDLAEYVMSLSGNPHDSLRAAKGQPKFVVCAACHGADGRGNTALGAPNLADDIWLHGWGRDHVAAIVTTGKSNNMPAQKDRLSAEQIKLLTAYVWGLSNKGLAK
jgi:cytochrome c oxidase cbb3-type subunit III